MQQTGTTQAALAEYLGTSRTAVSHYAQGRREPDLSTMIKIAEYFQVSLDYLAGLKDDEVPKSRSPRSYVKINGRLIRIYPGDTVRVSIGGKTFDFTVQEIEI